ncbi:hypothetical protein ABK040_000370 [Willaertia magna]
MEEKIIIHTIIIVLIHHHPTHHHSSDRNYSSSPIRNQSTKRSYNNYNDESNNDHQDYKKNKKENNLTSSSGINKINDINSLSKYLQKNINNLPTNLPSRGLTKEEILSILIRIRLIEINELLGTNGISTFIGNELLYQEIQLLIKFAQQLNPLFNFEQNLLNIVQYILEVETNIQSTNILSDLNILNNKNNKLNNNNSLIGMTKLLFSKKIYIPVNEYPQYNFIGLIIGPKGSTQKKLEKVSGAKIAVRGKGSVKPGKVTSTNTSLNNTLMSLTNSSMEEDLHVLITAEDEDSVEKAAEMVKRLLIPVEEGNNELKKEQLRELARLQGLLKEEDGISNFSYDNNLNLIENEMQSEDTKNALIAKLQSHGLNQHLADQPPIPGITSHIEIPGITDVKRMENALDKLKKELAGDFISLDENKLDNEQEQEENKDEIKIQAPTGTSPFEKAYEQTYQNYFDYYKQYFLQQELYYQKVLDTCKGYLGYIPNTGKEFLDFIGQLFSDKVPTIPGEVQQQVNNNLKQQFGK